MRSCGDFKSSTVQRASSSSQHPPPRARLDRPGGEGTPTFREFVTEQHCYFHPYGVGGWPTETANFMAFRWDGAVQRIHRLRHVEVVPTIRDRFPQSARERGQRAGAHAVYDLGPQIPLLKPKPNGTGVYPSSRLWVLLDQLLTEPTLKDAITATHALQETEAAL